MDKKENKRHCEEISVYEEDFCSCGCMDTESSKNDFDDTNMECRCSECKNLFNVFQ